MLAGFPHDKQSTFSFCNPRSTAFAFWHATCTSGVQQAAKFSSRRIFMKNYFIRGSVLALTLGVGSMGSLYAQEAKPAQNDPQAQPTQSQPAQNDAQASPTSAQTT